MYVKLFSSILRSSVWDEDPATRLTWITMLLLADEDGFVRGIASGLARQANIPADDFERALGILSAPDKRSQTPDHDGRRIESTEGGWMVLNYKKYREMRTRVQVREAEKKRRQRNRTKGADDGDAGGHGGHVPHVPTIASSSAFVSAGVVGVGGAGEGGPLSAHFAEPAHADAYNAYRRSHAMPDGLDAGIKALVSGMHGKPLTWEAVGGALVEMRAASVAFSPRALQGFARKLLEGSAGQEKPGRQDRNLAAITEGLRRYGNGES
jgi:hypothetical protein